MKPTLATHKIIILVVFVAAALMTSLFLFHLRQKPNTLVTASNDVMLFPAARDIKPFELKTADDNPFTQKNFLNHWTLLFFGFTHCSNVCPTTLGLLSRVYNQLHNAYPALQVVLISLDPERDTPNTLEKYTHSFHPDFIGATGKIQEIRKLQSQLGIFAARDNATTADNYQIQHTSSILLINPQGKWAGLFKYGMKPSEFANAFEAGVTSLSRSREG